jgi:4-hydroxy-2-oxoheptanedioate aldolase
MRTPDNAFKKTLTEPGVQIGLWLALADPYSAELCATAGFDWLLIDGGHGPNDLRSTLAVLQAVAPYRAHPVVRVPHSDPALLKQVLEIGATTLLVPMVDSAERARELVRAVRYPPEGVRGVGSGLARSSRWSAYPDYVQEANERICLLVQIESVAGLAALQEIAGIPGVDGVFIGAADLAASMGYLGRPAHPDVRAAIEKALAAIQESGKPAGMLETDEELARRSIELGARFVAVGVEASLLAGAVRSLAARFNIESAAPVGGEY